MHPPVLQAWPWGNFHLACVKDKMPKNGTADLLKCSSKIYFSNSHHELYVTQTIIGLNKKCQHWGNLANNVNFSEKNILSKNKKYPGNSFHAWVNRGEKTGVKIACLAMFAIWLCLMGVHFGFLCKCWNNGCFKHKKGSFLFSQIKTLKTAKFKCIKKFFFCVEA